MEVLMNITISLGLEDLKTLPLELRQKIQQALDLPVIQAAQPQTLMQYQAEAVQQIQNAGPAFMQHDPNLGKAPPQFTTSPPPAAFTFQPQQPMFSPPTQPVKEPVIVDGVRTFQADRNNPNAASVAVDVTTGQIIPLTAPAGNTPVVPQFSNAPLQVTPVAITGPVNPAPMPAANVNDVRSAAIRLWNGSVDGKQRLQAAIQSCGVQIAALSDQNAGALAQALRQQGVQI
jgi:hypothetical protein